MRHRSLIAGCIAILFWVFAVSVQTGRTAEQPAQQAPAQQAATAPAPAGAQAVPTDPAAITADHQRAFFKQYCFACHNEAAASRMDSARKLALDTLDFGDVDKDRRTWELIVRKVRAGQMPPAAMPRPEPARFDAHITALENELDRTGAPFMPPPGLHRLNRTEYANVVRDLLHLDIDPAKYLPSDDSTAGFDNIAGALTLSSTLVEAYVTAAQKISRLALGYPEDPTLVVYRTKEDTSQDYHIEGMPFGTRGGLLVKHVFPSDGEYTLTVTPIFGDNMSPTGFGSVPCEELLILLDGSELAKMPWQGGGRNQGNANCRNQGRGGRGGQAAAGGGGGGGFGRGGTPPMRVRFKTTAGPHLVGATYIATHFAPLLDLDRHFERSTIQTGPTPGYTFFPHVGTMRIEGPFEATPARDTPSRRKIFVCQPQTAAEETACARQILTNLATFAFRRPVADADLDLLMQFYQAGRQEKDFDLGIEMALARILASPQFIYRIEEAPDAVTTRNVAQRTPAPADREAYRLSDLDLASRLSFFLWSTMPDAELLKVAAAGQLSDPAVLEQQVRRMLRDPKAEALAVNFAGQWLNLRALDATSPLPLLYPDFDDPLRQAMRREVEMIFDTIVREDRSVLELLTADYTYVNERLAKYYGIKNIYGSQFRRVTLGPGFEARRGLLGKGAFLVTTSKPDRTSPVTRGKWIMSNLMGMSPPDPPPNVPPLPARDADPNAKQPTMRQKMVDHRVRSDCTSCHQLMDPIGFALENFDAIGLWRSHDEGQPVDPADTLFDKTKVDGPVSLREWLATYDDLFVTVATEKLMTYALGRGVEHRDMPLVRRIAREANNQEGRFSALVLGIVRSQPFQMNQRVDAPSGSTVARASIDNGGAN